MTPRHTGCWHVDCDQPHIAKGFCTRHYDQYRNYSNPRHCELQDCNRGHYGYGYCRRHYDQMNRGTTATLADRRGEAVRRRAAQQRAVFLEDYNDMRSWGMNDRQIAQRLGIKLESLQRRLQRNLSKADTQCQPLQEVA